MTEQVCTECGKPNLTEEKLIEKIKYQIRAGRVAFYKRVMEESTDGSVFID